MTDLVLKPFTSTLRRFAVGASINETDDVAPHSYGALKARGFVGASPKDEPTATPDGGSKSVSKDVPSVAAGE